MAVSRRSLGGSESLLAAESGNGIVAALDSAGTITWAAGLPLQQRMKRVARDAKVPVFVLQAENAAPGRVSSEAMRLAGKPRVHIFPPTGTTHEMATGFAQVATRLRGRTRNCSSCPNDGALTKVRVGAAASARGAGFPF